MPQSGTRAHDERAVDELTTESVVVVLRNSAPRVCAAQRSERSRTPSSSRAQAHQSRLQGLETASGGGYCASVDAPARWVNVDDGWAALGRVRVDHCSCSTASFSRARLSVHISSMKPIASVKPSGLTRLEPAVAVPADVEQVGIGEHAQVLRHRGPAHLGEVRRDLRRRRPRPSRTSRRDRAPGRIGEPRAVLRPFPRTPLPTRRSL